MGLYIQEFGSDTAPTIVFLHGGGVSGWMWQSQIEQLQDYHCLIPDLPEQGKSVNEKPFTIQDSAKRIAYLIKKQAHDGKAHVVGLSVGAQITLALLCIAPTLVDHAVVSSALVRPMLGGSLITPKWLALSYRWFIKPLKNSEWWIRLNMKYAAGISDEHYLPFSQSFRSMTETGFTNLMVENQRFRLPKGLERVQVPTLVVSGSGEKAAIPQSVLDIAAALPTSQAVEVQHTRQMSAAEEHNWALTAPELFTQTVRAWIIGEPLPDALNALKL